MAYEQNAGDNCAPTALLLLDPLPALQSDGGQLHRIRAADFPHASGEVATGDDNRIWAPVLASWSALLHCESMQGEYQTPNTRLHHERALACAIDVISHVGPQADGPLITGDAWISASQLLSEMAWSVADGITDRSAADGPIGRLTPSMRHQMTEALLEFAPAYRLLVAQCAGLTVGSLSGAVSVELARATPFEVEFLSLRGPRCYLWFAAERAPNGLHTLVAYSAVLRPDLALQDIDAKVLRWEVSGNIYHNKPKPELEPITLYAQGIEWMRTRFADPTAVPPMLQADIDPGQFAAELRKGTASARPSVHGWLAARTWLANTAHP